MATKATRRTPRTIGLNLRQAQGQAVSLLRRARRRVDHYLPEGPRKQLAEFEARVERATRDIGKARDRAVKQARSRVEALVDGVEKTALGVVKPVVHRLDLASRADVERLRRRIADLEKRVGKHAEVATA
jgi:hypothetical protein